jgi:hypothetical protein
MELSSEECARIRAEEEYRYKVFCSLAGSNKPSIWDRINSPIMMWLLGSVVLGLISFGYATYSSHLQTLAETRSLSYAIMVRLAPVEQLLKDVRDSGVMDDHQRYRISNSFTGQMEQEPDEFGKIGVPGLLFKYAAVSGNSGAAMVARQFLELMVPMEKEGLYMRGAGQPPAELTDYRRELIDQLSKLLKEAKRIVSG